ncbi:NUDIX domain-containing protein [Streptomyces sp. NPDC000075]|uniref:NUDIX domain-containing protein n=1 Tax=Streptomyces TaxID=1883 RepID=UPI0031DE91FF
MTLSKATVGGAVFFTDEHARPVRLRATYRSARPWQPGGVTEPGDPGQPLCGRDGRRAASASRDPKKFRATVSGQPCGDWPPATVGRVCDGGRLTPGQAAGIVLDPDEHHEVRALAVPERQGLMPGRDHTRVEAVMAARRPGIPAYFHTWDGEV